MQEIRLFMRYPNTFLNFLLNLKNNMLKLIKKDSLVKVFRYWLLSIISHIMTLYLLSSFLFQTMCEKNVINRYTNRIGNDVVVTLFFLYLCSFGMCILHLNSTYIITSFWKEDRRRKAIILEKEGKEGIKLCFSILYCQLDIRSSKQAFIEWNSPRFSNITGEYSTILFIIVFFSKTFSDKIGRFSIDDGKNLWRFYYTNWESHWNKFDNSSGWWVVFTFSIFIVYLIWFSACWKRNLSIMSALWIILQWFELKYTISTTAIERIYSFFCHFSFYIISLSGSETLKLINLFKM